jgi:hypothetical protein
MPQEFRLPLRNRGYCEPELYCVGHCNLGCDHPRREPSQNLNLEASK